QRLTGLDRRGRLDRRLHVGNRLALLLGGFGLRLGLWSRRRERLDGAKLRRRRRVRQPQRRDGRPRLGRRPPGGNAAETGGEAVLGLEHSAVLLRERVRERGP